MRCETFSGVKRYNYSLKCKRLLKRIYERIESVMLQCSCYHCQNRQIGCHKFCPEYRKYRRELEEMKAKEKRENEGVQATLNSLLTNNSRRK